MKGHKSTPWLGWGRLAMCRFRPRHLIIAALLLFAVYLLTGNNNSSGSGSGVKNADAFSAQHRGDDGEPVVVYPHNSNGRAGRKGGEEAGKAARRPPLGKGVQPKPAAHAPLPRGQAKLEIEPDADDLMAEGLAPAPEEMVRLQAVGGKQQRVPGDTRRIRQKPQKKDNAARVMGAGMPDIAEHEQDQDALMRQGAGAGRHQGVDAGNVFGAAGLGEEEGDGDDAAVAQNMDSVMDNLAQDAENDARKRLQQAAQPNNVVLGTGGQFGEGEGEGAEAEDGVDENELDGLVFGDEELQFPADDVEANPGAGEERAFPPPPAPAQQHRPPVRPVVQQGQPQVCVSLSVYVCVCKVCVCGGGGGREVCEGARGWRGWGCVNDVKGG